MMDQGASSAGEIIFLENSHAEASLGKSSSCCNSANARACRGLVCMSVSSWLGQQEDGVIHETYIPTTMAVFWPGFLPIAEARMVHEVSSYIECTSTGREKEVGLVSKP